MYGSAIPLRGGVPAAMAQPGIASTADSTSICRVEPRARAAERQTNRHLGGARAARASWRLARLAQMMARMTSDAEDAQRR